MNHPLKTLSAAGDIDAEPSTDNGAHHAEYDSIEEAWAELEFIRESINNAQFI